MAINLRSAIQQSARAYGVDPRILTRLIQQESGGNESAVSSAGARGVAQFMPGTAADVARKLGVSLRDFWADPNLQVEGAALYLSEHLDRYGGDYRKALAAYNAGPGAVDTYGGVPPYQETQSYLASILGPSWDDEDPVEDPDDPEGDPDEPPDFGDDEDLGEEDLLPDLGGGDDGAPSLGGDGTGGETVADYTAVTEGNPYAHLPASQANILEAGRWEIEERNYARQQRSAEAAEQRIRSRPRVGPSSQPLAEIPREAWTQGNPWAGISDKLAETWERENGSLRSASSKSNQGTLTDMIARLRSSILGYQEASVPGAIGESAQPQPLSGRFTAPPSPSGNTTDIWKGAQGFSGVSPQESSYYLPFFNQNLGGPQRAVTNALSSAGFNTTVGNPYVQHLQALGTKMSDQALLQRLIKGEVPDERVVASDILSALSAGKTRIFTPETLRSELSTLKGTQNLNPTQESVVAAFENDPEFATRTFESTQNLPPDWQKYRRLAESRRYESFLNKAPSMTNKGLFDFILGGA